MALRLYDRANKTVARSYAEACFVADSLLGIAIVIATVYRVHGDRGRVVALGTSW